MNYKGYEVAVHFAEDDACFVGTVVNIAPPTIIAFDAQNVDALVAEFHQAIDSYLANAKNPKNPMSGKMTLRMSPTIHAKVLGAAYNQGLSANKFIIKALKNQLST